MARRKPHLAGGGVSGIDNDNWCTPPEVLDLVRLVAPDGVISLDPCSNPGSQVGALRNIGKLPWAPGTAPYEAHYEVGDGIQADWEGFVYCNPPYSKIAPWAHKALVSAVRFNTETLLVIPPSTAAWFHHLAAGPTTFCFLNGRIAFLQGKAPVKGNSRGTMVTMVSPRPVTHHIFREIFDPLGTCFAWEPLRP